MQPTTSPLTARSAGFEQRLDVLKILPQAVPVSHRAAFIFHFGRNGFLSMRKDTFNGVAIDLKTTQILSVLRDQDGEHHAVMLRSQHLSHALALHEAALSADKDTRFLVRRDDDYFASHLEGRQGSAVLGIVSEGRLTGQAVIHHSDDTPASALQGMSLFRPGKVFRDALIKLWDRHAVAHGKETVVARVKIDNLKALSMFSHRGLHIVSFDKGQRTRPVYNLQGKAGSLGKSLSAAFSHAGIEVPLSDIGLQQMLLDDGYVGMGLDHKGRTIIMSTPHPTLSKAA